MHRLDRLSGLMACVVVAVIFALSATASAQVFNGPGVNVNLPAGTPGHLETLNVAGAPTDVQAFRVTLNFTHDWIADLVVYLLPPGVDWVGPVDGNNVPAGAILLFEEHGGGTQDMVNTVITGSADGLYNAANGSITLGAGPFTGTFTCTDDAAFNTIYGTDGNGQWQLAVWDVFDLADDGILNSWSIEFGVSQTPSITVTANGNPVASGTPIAVAAGATLDSLNLQIGVSDPQNDNVSVAATVTGMTFEGLVETEFESAAAATPYTLSPATGRFIASNALISVALVADDGNANVTNFNLQFQVSNGLVSLQNFASASTPQAIPDSPNDGLINSITVAGGPSSIWAMRVNMDITHTFDGDLHVWLLPPGVTWGALPVRPNNQPAGAVELVTDFGGGGDNFTNTRFTSPTDPHFAVANQQSITAGVAPFTGTFTPEGSAAFQNLYGTNANGTWSLVVIDDFGSDFGTLNSWSIDLYDGSAPAVTVTVNGNAINSGATVNMPLGTTLASMNLQIGVDDGNAENTSLEAAILGVTTEGILTAEFEAAAGAVPYVVNPTTGTFNVANADIEILVVAEDATGNRAPFTFTIHVTADPISVLVNGLAISDGATVDVPFLGTLAAQNIQIRVYDAQNDPTSVAATITGITTEGIDELEFESAAQAPIYTISPTTGTFNVGGATIAVVLISDDGNGNVFQFDFTLQVGANQAPTIAVTAGGNPVTNGGTINAGFLTSLSALNLAIGIDDPESSNTFVTATFGGVTTEGLVQGEFESAAAGVPYSLTPNTGTFNAANATITVQLTAEDAQGVQATFNFTIQVGANQPPTITAVANGNPLTSGSTINVDFNSTLAALALGFTVADPDGGNISLSAVVAGVTTEGIVNAEFTNAAAAGPYTVNPTTGTFNVPGATINVTLTADDGSGGTVNFAVTFFVNRRPTFAVTRNGGVVVSNGGTIDVAANSAFSAVGLAITVNDPDGDDTAITAAITGMTTEGLLQAEFENAQAAVPYTINPTTGTFNVGSATIVVTLTATDATGNQDTFSVTFQVTAVGGGTAPTITSTAPTAGLVGATFTYTITATGAPTPNISVTGLPAWLTFDVATGTISGTPAAGNVGTTPTITVTASNGVGADATEPFTVTVTNPQLVRGDMSIIGVRTDDPDGFAFVVWKKLAPGTVLHFTDNSFDGSALRTTESIMDWTAPAVGIGAGTVIVITAGSPNATANLGTCTGSLSNLDDATGDQVFCFEGDLRGGPNFLFGVNIGNVGWITSGTATDSTSYLPAVLATFSINVGALNTDDNGQFGGSRSNLASFAAYKPVVQDAANWATDDNGANFTLDSTTFKVAGNSAPTITVTANGNPVTDGQVFTVKLGDPLSNLDLQIAIADADTDTTELTVDITNLTTEGVVLSEWRMSPGAPAPYTRTPTSGTMVVAIDHVVTLLANDGKGGIANFTVSIQVQAPQQNNPTGKKGCGVLGDGSEGANQPTLPVLVLALIVVLAVIRRRIA